MYITDSIAFASRKLAQTRLHKLSGAMRRFYPVKRGLTTIEDFDGDLKICIDRGRFMSNGIYWKGYHSGSVARFMKSYLRPDMSFVDVGANMGELTLLAAKRLTRGRVFAFEPNPVTFSELSRNVALNNLPRINLYNIGLYDKTDTLPMYGKQVFKYGTVNDGVHTLFSAGTEPQDSVVQLRRFDDVAREYSLDRLDLMKIDVEGAEMMVLRGAEASIKRFRPVIITEMSEEHFKRAGYTPSDLINYLNRLEYDVHLLDGEDGRLPLQCDMICRPRRHDNQ